MSVDLTKCDQVAKRELGYLHDHQVLLQEIIKIFGGQVYFDEKVAPKLSKQVYSASDFLEQVGS